jgi:adenylylsulfate kinase
MKSAMALWLTGLSGSGKSTLAVGVKQELEKNGIFIKLFDGDIMRKGLNSDLGFSLKDRAENIRRISEVNKLFLETGIYTINAFISPTEEIRKIAREIIGKDRFFEIYLSTPLKICMERDPKGLYKRIANGEIKDFTGLDSVFEPSQFAQLSINTSNIPLKDCVKLILDQLSIV